MVPLYCLLYIHYTIIIYFFRSDSESGGSKKALGQKVGMQSWSSYHKALVILLFTFSKMSSCLQSCVHKMNASLTNLTLYCENLDTKVRLYFKVDSYYRRKH